MQAFFDELPFTPPLFSTPKGDAVVHLTAHVNVVVVKWLASLQRGTGRAALTAIIEAADRHGVTLQLTARPQQSPGEGKKMKPARLEAFYAGFGFVVIGRNEFAHMERKPEPKEKPE